MEYYPVPDELIDFIKTKNNFLLLSHIDPDGDCIASSLALGTFLKRIGKQVSYYNPGPFGRREITDFARYFQQHITDIADRANSAAIVLDCSTEDRIGHLAGEIGDLPLAVIDHHSTGREFGKLRFINSTAPSTSLLVQQLIEEMGYSPSIEESEYIFFAFTTDTGFFRHLGEQTQASFQMVAKLVKAGVSPRKMYQKITQGVSLESRKHLGMMLERTQSFFDGKMLYTWETLEEMRHFGRENRDSDTLYQQLMNVSNTEIVLVLREEEPGLTTGSIRTSEYIDAGKLAEEFGGGGHARAAGFSCSDSIAETCEQLKERIGTLL